MINGVPMGTQPVSMYPPHRTEAGMEKDKNQLAMGSTEGWPRSY